MCHLCDESRVEELSKNGEELCLQSDQEYSLNKNLRNVPFSLSILAASQFSYLSLALDRLLLLLSSPD